MPSRYDESNLVPLNNLAIIVMIEVMLMISFLIDITSMFRFILMFDLTKIAHIARYTLQFLYCS